MTSKREVAEHDRRLGWEVIPVVPGGKAPTSSATGHTGHAGVAATDDEFEQWCASDWSDDFPECAANIGLRLPDDVIVIDVDNMRGKMGGTYLEVLEKRLGKLPPTYKVTRYSPDDPHGHLYFRVPPARRWKSSIRVKRDGKYVSFDIDIRSRGVSYVLAPGSSVGATTYVGYDQRTGMPAYDVAPDSELIADLSEKWVEFLSRGGAADHAGTTPDMSASLAEWLELVRPGPPSSSVAAVVSGFRESMETGGSAHELMVPITAKLVSMATQAEPGVATAIDMIREEFVLTLPSHRGRGWTERQSANEFDRALLGAIQKFGNLPHLRWLKENGYRHPGFDVALPDGQQPGEFTDAALAPRIARELGDGGTPVAWSSGLGWLHWTGKYWLACDTATITELVRRHVRDWFGREVRGGFVERERFAELNRVQARGRIGSIVALMQGVVERSEADFDRHLDLLNAQNGVVNLRTGEVVPHHPKFGFTRIAAVDYAPEAVGTSSDWEQAKEALPEAERRYLLARLGQAITGYPPDDDRVIFLVGGGANGKTTFMKPVVQSLGDFAGIARQELLIATAGQHPEIFMDLLGRRVMLMDETAEGKLDALRLKRLVGTEKISARHLYRSAISWDPTHSIFVASNHLAEIADSDRGTWRRLLLVKFPYVFGGEPEVHGPLAQPMDIGLRPRLAAREVQEAVLAELVVNAMAWFAAGQRLPSPPTEVLRETHAWRDEADLIGQFVGDRIEASPAGVIALSALTAEYNLWAQPRGHDAISQTTLKKRLSSHECLPSGLTFSEGRKRVGGTKNPVTVWIGVRLT